MLNPHLWALCLGLFLTWRHPSPRNTARIAELASVAVDIASTDATEEEARTLAKIAQHETNVHPRDVGKAGERTAWQIMPPGPFTVGEALRRVRWSHAACGDLSLYAGCGKCGACSWLVKELAEEKLGDFVPPRAYAKGAVLLSDR